jgi:hypothetical protein
LGREQLFADRETCETRLFDFCSLRAPQHRWARWQLWPVPSACSQTLLLLIDLLLQEIRMLAELLLPLCVLTFHLFLAPRDLAFKSLPVAHGL